MVGNFDRTESIFFTSFLSKEDSNIFFSPSNPTEPFNPTAGILKPDFLRILLMSSTSLPEQMNGKQSSGKCFIVLAFF
ncbi:hypothetical protein CU019_2718 [Enterococcus faecium]|nr:hypothetical protein [Enterococcus faecium]MBK4799893.1 hypothetical protein [Enterococcus faecium]MBK4821344.1 hypothetical protein [Enterococcus faecium]